MTPFRPLTLGYDWELWVLGETGEPEKESKIQEIADALRRARPECPVGLDFRSLEIRSGPCAHVDELRERTDFLLRMATREAKRKRLALLPSAGHPFYYNVLGAHVHVGSLFDLERGVRLRAALMPYLPALIAISVASPVFDERVGEFKSYRVAYRAHQCDLPVPISDPATTNLAWGEDACVKVAWKPTMELRLFDAPIHVPLYMELAVVGAGLVCGVERRLGRRATASRTAREGEDYLLNRLAAARHGLQATFRRGDDAIDAVRAVEEVLEIAAEGMEELGLPVRELVWIPRLLRRRITQADFLVELYERSPDAWSFLSVLSATVSDGRGFERWVRSNPTKRRSVGVESFGPHILAAVNGSARVLDANRWLALPPAVLEREVRELVRAGELERVEDPDRGLRFRRTVREGRT